ncbi:F-box protein At2g23160-like [Salvia hispanica]|uniref:F-box protein At2g23160-like n=1 Tax=Salvia hispanica TaxID=49212 RepID=UPI0020096606|nr:F-box protein At2g23160-like [Salvia hispanica]
MARHASHFSDSGWILVPFIMEILFDPYSVVTDSTEGLLLARGGSSKILFVCNPMTEEYVVLPCLYDNIWIYGFGLSKISGQYKVLSGPVFSGSYLVYTLGGGGSWRSIFASPPGSPVMLHNNAIFCNGNLHWLVSHFDFEDRYMVCCFDLETELFNSFALPPHVSDSDIHGKYRLCILEGRLCLCYCLGG